MIRPSKGHVFHACVKKHDFGTFSSLYYTKGKKNICASLKNSIIGLKYKKMIGYNYNMKQASKGHAFRA